MEFYLFVYLFAQDHSLIQYFVDHCSDSIEQEVSEAFLGLSRRPPLLTDKNNSGDVRNYDNVR